MIKFEFNDFKISNFNIDDVLTDKMIGWHNVDNLFSNIDEINNTASFVRSNCDVFLVIGIGGSFLGSKAVIEALNPYFYNSKLKPSIYFVGTSLSSDYYSDLIELIKDKDIIVNVISKSGNTLETNLFYNLILELMESKYSSSELSKRVIITTNDSSGLLLKEVGRLNCKSFIVPDNIGGRYSVFSPVGLLPIAVSGIDINKLYIGCKRANEDYVDQVKYALTRKKLYDSGKVVEAYVVYEPKLEYFVEWLKQLYAESLGKKNKGILPISIVNTRDLHSMGQFIQEGNKVLFETVIEVLESDNTIYIDKYGKNLNEINSIACKATSKAHLSGNVFNNKITIDKLDEETIGYLLQFFMTSCAISGYIEGVNAFNQEGVEEYKKNINELL